MGRTPPVDRLRATPPLACLVPDAVRRRPLRNPLNLADGFNGGIGLAAVAVPAICMLGGYAIAGRGPSWVRGSCWLVTLSAIPMWSLTATDLSGSSMSLANPHGAWAAVLYWGLLATFSLAAAIPHRRPVRAFNPESRPPPAPSTTTTTYR